MVRSSGSGAYRVSDTSMVIEGERLSFLGSHWFGKFLVGIWIEGSAVIIVD